MAELATIARPYAEALFKASGSDLAAAAAWMDSLGTIAEDVQLLQFAANPKATVDQVFDLISAVVPTALSAPAQNFLRTVISNGRLSVLPEIALASVGDGAMAVGAGAFVAFAIASFNFASAAGFAGNGASDLMAGNTSFIASPVLKPPPLNTITVFLAGSTLICCPPRPEASYGIGLPGALIHQPKP